MHPNLIHAVRFAVALASLIAFVFGFAGWSSFSALAPLAGPQGARP